MFASFFLTGTVYLSAVPVLKLLGAQCAILKLAIEYIRIIAIGAGLQILGTGLVPFFICIIHLILQGVGDGSQPLMSKYYGEKNSESLKNIRRLAYYFAVFLAFTGCIIILALRNNIGVLFGSSSEVNSNIAAIIPIFLVSLPFVAIIRIATAGFYATEQSLLSYILTFTEPLLMLVLMLILPPLFGGQIMIWWSTVFARIISAVFSLILTLKYNHTNNL